MKLRGIQVLIIIAFLASLVAGAGYFRYGFLADSEHYLVFDVAGLIDDYYHVAVKKPRLLEDAFRGIALEMALKQLEKEREAEKSEAENKPAVEEPKPEQEVKKEAPDSPMDLPTSEIEEELENKRREKELLAKAPFSYEKTPDSLVLKVGDSKIELEDPIKKRELVNSYMEGYRFLMQHLGMEDADREMFYAGINGMVQYLDPHSSFLDPTMYRQLREETSGSFAGVGIEVGIRRNKLTVISPIVGTPAYRANLAALDHIAAVNGKPTEGMTLMEAVELIRGKVGTPVVLTIARKGREPFDVELIREKIEETSVKYEMLPKNIGYVQIFKFNEKTGDSLNTAVEEMKIQSGDKLRGIILDLRYNPGGLLSQAVAVADKFLDSGAIVNTMGRGMFVDKTRYAESKGTEANLPLLVLINFGSASGSEIVAGALQDRKRALLVGTRSFGKGTVQSIFELEGDAALRLTTALYYTPSGRSIQATGIVPDINFTDPEQDQLLASYSEQALDNHIPNKGAPVEESKFDFPAERIYNYYLAQHWISQDPDYPAKSDWVLAFAQKVMDSDHLSVPDMQKRAVQLLKQIPVVEPPAQTQAAAGF